MALYTYGPIYLWPYILMAPTLRHTFERRSAQPEPIMLWPYVVMTLYSYGPIQLWPCIVMALYSCGPV